MMLRVVWLLTVVMGIVCVVMADVWSLSFIACSLTRAHPSLRPLQLFSDFAEVG